MHILLDSGMKTNGLEIANFKLTHDHKGKHVCLAHFYVGDTIKEMQRGGMQNALFVNGHRGSVNEFLTNETSHTF